MIKSVWRTGAAAALLGAVLALAGPPMAAAQDTLPPPTLPADPNLPTPPPVEAPRTSAFSAKELVEVGHGFFGDVSQGLASVVEHATSRFGLPNGYIIGQEASGALVGGARYGEGTLYTKNAGQHRVYWQGPSIGLDVGANGDRVMMLIYNLPTIDSMYQRYVGVNGSAYVVAGLGMTVLSRRGIYVVPIVSGLGARLGINFGYLKFTSQPTWNPF